MNSTLKKCLTWGSAIGISGGVIVTILVFALNAYVAGVVKTATEEALEKVPTVISLNAQLVMINDGIADNATAIGELKVSQDEFRLLFIEYLQRQAE